MSMELTTGEDRLAIRLTGMDRIYALDGKVEVPLDAIADLRVEPRRAMEAERGVRLPGGAYPAKLAVGTWRGRGGKQFWCVHAAERVLVIDLERGEYRRLVLEVADPDAEAIRIWTAAAGAAAA